MEQIGFLPHLQESVMEELRTTEGMLFRDESAKKLFIDVKSLVVDSLSSAYRSFDKEIYAEVLDRYQIWDEHVSKEEMTRCGKSYPDVSERLTKVTLLYAKYLYARNSPDHVINIRKPKLESLLRGLFTRMASMHHVRNGSFFDLDPLRQDFVIRDIFRQALATDCISVVDKSPDVVVYDDVRLEKDDDEVYPDDSISAVMSRMDRAPERREERLELLPPLSEDKEEKEEKLDKLEDIKSVIKVGSVIRDNKTQITAATKATKNTQATHMTSRTKVTECRVPKEIRKVVLDPEITPQS